MTGLSITRSIIAAIALLAGGSAAAAAQQDAASIPRASQASKEAFTEARFATLQEQGALVLLDVFAPWCPTCAIQQRILADYAAKHPDVPLHVLTIDFDSQKEFVQKFRAPRQSTLILYRGKERIWFGVAETRPAVIFAELNRAAAGQE